jgi:hypothetical protein
LRLCSVWLFSYSFLPKKIVATTWQLNFFVYNYTNTINILV